jgi:hypothetical protein
MRQRLTAACGAYLILGVLAVATLDGVLRTGVLILLAGLAVKTFIAYKAGW